MAYIFQQAVDELNADNTVVEEVETTETTSAIDGIITSMPVTGEIISELEAIAPASGNFFKGKSRSSKLIKYPNCYSNMLLIYLFCCLILISYILLIYLSIIWSVKIIVRLYNSLGL